MDSDRQQSDKASPRDRSRGQRGQVLIEFAFVAPIIFLFMFVVIDFGIGVNHRVVVTNAAREAARYAATGKSEAEITARAVEQSEGLVTDADVEVQFFDTDGDGELLPGDSVAVRLQYTYRFVTPLSAIGNLWGGAPTSFEMNACTDMRLEQVWAGATAQPPGAPSPCS
jgi:hypothetical protein